MTETLDRLWRAESGNLRAVLARRLGDLELAEEALQEAVGQALRHWPQDGVPERPAGWLATTAWRKAVDQVRRERTGQEKLALLAADPGGGPTATAPAGTAPVPAADDRLALTFACCHPSLSRPAQVALTLHAVAGLTAAQIAAGFLLPTATLAQRLVRARRQLRRHGVRFEVPALEELPHRLPGVLTTLYLVYNEGYLAHTPDRPWRWELAREALELARQLTGRLPGEPEAAGLAALLELHQARATTRFGPHGELVPLPRQDRSRWHQGLIVTAAERLARAVARDRPGPYQLQAAIALHHATAASYADTDWTAIRALYDQLVVWTSSPVVRLARAVATRYVVGPAAALAEADGLAGELGHYRFWHATRAELLRALGRSPEAAESDRRALALAVNPAERRLLADRLH